MRRAVLQQFLTVQYNAALVDQFFALLGAIITRGPFFEVFQHCSLLDFIILLFVRCSRVFKLCTRAVPHLAVRIQHCYAAACAWVCARQVCDAYAAHGIAVDLLVSASSCFTPIFTAISPRIDLEAYLDYFHAAVSPTLLFSSVGFGSKRCVNLSFCCHPLHAFASASVPSRARCAISAEAW